MPVLCLIFYYDNCSYDDLGGFENYANLRLQIQIFVIFAFLSDFIIQLNTSIYLDGNQIK